MRLCGTFREKLSTGTHDPLKAPAMVFQQGEEKSVIAGCDVTMMSPAVTTQVRKNIEHLGFPPGAVIIHASETHNAPDHYGEFREAFHADALKTYGTDPAEPIDFPELLITKLTEAIKGADSALSESIISVGKAEMKGIGFNRRFLMKDGTIGWNPGKLNPDTIKPAGPAGHPDVE